ncbi:MAG: hypothetical protein K6C32_01765 [Bacilli bacterium]|nr:hypothetical protein [Bacilli bacterium]
MINIKKPLLAALDIDPTKYISRLNKYYWIEGCKYILFVNRIVFADSFPKILDDIGHDGKSYPFNSNYLIIVIAPTHEQFDKKDLYYERDLGENVVFVLYNETKRTVFYSTAFNFPLRFSYRKITRKIAGIILELMNQKAITKNS